MFEQQNKEKGMELVGFNTIWRENKTTAAGLKLQKK